MALWPCPPVLLGCPWSSRLSVPAVRHRPWSSGSCVLALSFWPGVNRASVAAAPWPARRPPLVAAPSPVLGRLAGVGGGAVCSRWCGGGAPPLVGRRCGSSAVCLRVVLSCSLALSACRVGAAPLVVRVSVSCFVSVWCSVLVFSTTRRMGERGTCTERHGIRGTRRHDGTGRTTPGRVGETATPGRDTAEPGHRSAGTTRAYGERGSAGTGTGQPASGAGTAEQDPGRVRVLPSASARQDTAPGDTATGHETGRRWPGDPGRLCGALAVMPWSVAGAWWCRGSALTA